MDGRVVIALFRHGLTLDNKRKAYLGWNDSPLCAESLELSTTKRYERYFSSDLKRSIRTSKLLFSTADLILLVQLREMNFGKWEGHTYQDLKEDWQYQRWLSDPIHYCPPEGEFFQQFINRVQSGWEEITQEILSTNLQSCAIITHGGVIRYLLSEFGADYKEFWSWHVPHDYGFELIFDRGALRRGERCTLLREVPLTAKEHG
jgi:alpha-ribazole phosphatase